MTKSRDVLAKYDLSSVRGLFTGAAPLGRETADDLQDIFPKWAITQGYGLTETSTVVCATSPDDVWFGTSGSLMPGNEARLVTIEGNEIDGYDQPGELWVKGPSIVLGYLKNSKATKETFVDGFMRTGDEAIVSKNPKTGYEHITIVDRLKELIKVKVRGRNPSSPFSLSSFSTFHPGPPFSETKIADHSTKQGLQVAPAELEAHLLTHPAVNDCVVVGVPSDREGEVPKAFVVKSPSVGLEESDRTVARDIAKHVEQHKARHKWLKGGVEFIDAVPKSPSGKILRRLIRDQEKDKRRKAGARL